MVREPRKGQRGGKGWDPGGSGGRGGLSQQEHTARHWLGAREKVWKGGVVGPAQRNRDWGPGPHPPRVLERLWTHL